jgi:hypothetical protein
MKLLLLSAVFWLIDPLLPVDIIVVAYIVYPIVWLMTRPKST